MACLTYIAVAIVGYLLGSIPTGFLVARARGVDIRAVGSGNIGATNAFRVLGRPAGLFVLLADALKGILAVGGAPWLAVTTGMARTTDVEWLHLLGGLMAVVGHNYTCWLWFKGGKGVATTGGVLLALMPAAFAISLGVWLVVIAVTRYVSLASMAAAVSLPVATAVNGGSRTLVVMTAGLGALAIYKHLPNLKRLLGGTEHRLGSTPAPPS